MGVQRPIILRKMENKLVFKIIQIVLDIVCFGLFLGYMCGSNYTGKNNSCHKFGSRNTYDFTALIFALLFSTVTAIISCIGNVCPCNYEQFEKVGVFTVTVFMMVAACFESVGKRKDIWMATAFFFWFAFFAYLFELIIDHDLFGQIGFSSSTGGGGAKSTEKPTKKNKVKNEQKV